MIEHANAGNTELESYYDQRQHIQKIFLNSMYGYLGLVGARFYDLDNASAVTLTGQDVIKSSALYANKQYQQKYKTDKDYCIYVDTDSLYLHNPDYLVNSIAGGAVGHEDPLTASIASAFDMEKKLNSFYDIFAKRAFNCDVHRFRIKGESVARKGLWLAKKRYVLDKVYDLEKNAPTSKKMFKGVDVVRSSFPKAFRIFMTQMFNDILAGEKQSKIDKDILELRRQLPSMDFIDIARNTSANNLSKFMPKQGFSPIKGTPSHIKACISHNKLITYFNIKDKFDFIRDGEKVKCVYLKKNPLRVESVGIRGYQDPPEILELINQYIDIDAIFDSDLKKKLQYVYDALGWGLIPTKINQNASEFFSF